VEKGALSMSGATFKSVDRFGEGQVRGVQQVQALRWKSTFDVNKGATACRVMNFFAKLIVSLLMCELKHT